MLVCNMHNIMLHATFTYNIFTNILLYAMPSKLYRKFIQMF